jgi:pimeloyl-ACP methyl ester carboxylesterase
MFDIAQKPSSPGHEKSKALYDLDSTTVYASRHDSRFPYALYVPREILESDNDVELVVVMHGTGRQFTQYRDAFAPFGRWNRCIVLCPLFPVGVLGDDNRNGFKRLVEGDIRYDKVLLDMVSEVGERYGKRFDKFALFGYSGGGQYVNRFAYVHPERLWAASIGAPGNVTVLDQTKDWWLGVGGFERHFGKPFDPAALKRVPVQMVVGRADLETWEITVSEDSPMYLPGINDAGATRRDRLRTLKASFEAAGIPVRFDELDNIAHNGMQVVEVVQDFFARILREMRVGE